MTTRQRVMTVVLTILGLILLVLLNLKEDDTVQLGVKAHINIKAHADPLARCRKLGIEIVPERTLRVIDGVMMPYPGGSFMMYDCDGNVFGIRVPNEP